MIDEPVRDHEWSRIAANWIQAVDSGDRNREFLLDRAMLDLTGELTGAKVLDIGCGEGRFCRMLSERGALTTGIDPTPELLRVAKQRHPLGSYVDAKAELLPFADCSFDLASSYLVLIDVPDHRSAIQEMARVVRKGGRLLVANVNPFSSTRPAAWYRNEKGKKLHVAVEDYYEERPVPINWLGGEVNQYHRPMESYMAAFLGEGLVLSEFREPRPTPEAVKLHPEMLDEWRVPLFHVMLWTKPSG